MKRLLIRIGLIAIAGCAVLFTICLVRTLSLKPLILPVDPPASLAFDEQAAIQKLAGALRIATVSTKADNGPPAELVTKLRLYLQDAYPEVRAAVPVEVFDSGALLFRWPGREQDLDPIVLLAHLDVVPVADESAWTHPPFAGVIADGYLWGRGALDDKAGACAQLEAVAQLAILGDRPRRTTYLAFGFDEEVGGETGAQQIATLLAERGVRPALVLDEGYAVLEQLVPILDAPVAAIGIAEKGVASVELRVRGVGGHSSMPPSETAISILANAVAAVQSKPFPGGLDGAAGLFFDHLAPHADFGPRWVLANRWLLGGVLEAQLSAADSTNAILRTTIATTMIEGGTATNVLPSEARAVVNLRVHSRDTIAGAVEHMRAAIDDPRVELTILDGGSESTLISTTEGPGWDALVTAIQQTFPDAVVAPSLVVAATDARWYTGLTPHVYRFRPFPLQADDLARFHGVDERIRVEDYARMVRFYAALLRAL